MLAHIPSRYWFQRIAIARQLQHRNEINRKISLREFQSKTGSDEQEWLKTSKAKEFIEEMRSQMLDEKLCRKQAHRLQLEPGKEDKTFRRVFMKFFTTSKRGLGIMGTGAGKRESSVQGNFRAALLEVSRSRHPDPARQTIWCPIISSYIDMHATTAAHIFAFHHGQDTMEAIFGPSETPELFSPLNGILMSSAAESRFDKGYFVIVPRTSPNPSRAEVQDWHNWEPKEYQIRVLEPDVKEMNLFISTYSNKKWKELDGQPVTFKSSFRPRARYLYFHYCVTILRRSWVKDQPSVALRDELGRLYWGTPGRFMRKNMLLAFVEELGHDYEALLDGAIEEADEPAAVETALAAANDQIKISTKGKDALSYGGGESDEEDSEDEE